MEIRYASSVIPSALALSSGDFVPFAEYIVLPMLESIAGSRLKSQCEE